MYDGTDLWKKKGDSEFNIQMGSWDGAESTDVVGLFLLDKLSKIKVNGYTINVGIYIDDYLLVTRLTPRLTQKLTEKLQEIFDEYDLTTRWFEISWSWGPWDLLTLGPLDLGTSSYFPLHSHTSYYLCLLLSSFGMVWLGGGEL